jgi:hypothetical protein
MEIDDEQTFASESEVTSQLKRQSESLALTQIMRHRYDAAAESQQLCL